MFIVKHLMVESRVPTELGELIDTCLSVSYLIKLNKGWLYVYPTLRAVLCRLCIVSLRWRNRKGQELIR